MTSEPSLPRDLADRDLLTELEEAASCERRATARLIALLIEVDSRKLYADRGYSSLFTYCVQKLHLSEHAAYLRIEAARSTRRFPAILDRLGDGSLHLTAISLLAPHLTAANHVDVLDSAKHKSKRDVEQLIARLRPQPDVPSVVRKLPTPASPLIVEVPAVDASVHTLPLPQDIAPAPTRPTVIKPLTPERYKVQFTVSRETHEKLCRVQDLMRHLMPDGDLSAIFDRALALLLADLSKAKYGATKRPKRGAPAPSHSRHISAATRRDVWSRDGGRCAFRGEEGRCTETGFLEFHHVVPYADGGGATARNIELRCRAHNQYEADLWSGSRAPQLREARAEFSAESNSVRTELGEKVVQRRKRVAPHVIIKNIGQDTAAIPWSVSPTRHLTLCPVEQPLRRRPLRSLSQGPASLAIDTRGLAMSPISTSSTSHSVAPAAVCGAR
jgi:hypothetical protein